MCAKQPLNSSFSFDKKQRLKSPADFQRVYRSKQWGGSKHHTFNINPINTEQSLPFILGITVSKKVSKRAIDRNRIKRQIKEFFRLRQHQLPNTELVITARPSCNAASDQDRIDSLNELWSKIMRWQSWYQRQTR